MISDHNLQIDDPRDRKKYAFHTTVFRRVLVGFLRLFLRLFIKVETQGMEHLPADGPVVLASNHLTNFDVFPMQIVIDRPLFFMAKSELYKNPIMNWALRNLGAFPVYRGQRDQWAIRHAQKVLEHGQVLAIFPEGTRSKGHGLRSGKTGAARLAIDMECQILPVAIQGTHRIFKYFPRRTKIILNFGKPIYPKVGESTLGLTDRLMFDIAELLPVELRGVYTRKPIGFTFD